MPDAPTNPTIFGREPVVILAFLQAALALAVSYGFNASGEQTGVIMAFAAAALALAARPQVTPNANVALTQDEKAALEKAGF